MMIKSTGQNGTLEGLLPDFFALCVKTLMENVSYTNLRDFSYRGLNLYGKWVRNIDNG
jgi:hypothetical protein